MSLAQRELDASFKQVLANGLHGVAFENHLALCAALGRPIEAYRTLRLRCDAPGADPDDWFDWFNATSAAFNAALVDEVLSCGARVDRAMEVPADILVANAGMVALFQSFHGASDQGQLEASQRRYAERLRAHPALSAVEPFQPRRARSPNEPARIGYLWDFFGGGVEFCLPKHHDRRQCQVIGIGTMIPGVTAEEMGFDQFVGHDGRGLAQSVAAARALDLDLLIDLNGRGGSWRSDLLVEARVAPLQAAYGNFFCSTFSPATDALIGDKAILAGLVGRTTESLIPIDEPIMAVRNRSFVAHSEQRGAPPRPFEHRIGTTGNFWKISDDLIRLIVRVLQAKPNCSFFYASIPSREHVGRLKDRFLAFGANESQIELFPSSKIDYVSSINAIDAAIDSIPYNGHLSTTEFLSMGCPVWSLSGNRLSQRYGRMILGQAELQEYLFDDADALIAAFTQRLTVRTAESSAPISGKLAESRLWDPSRATMLMERAIAKLRLSG